jgi:ArsR family transcriptional regulator
MDKLTALDCFSALSQETRLDVLRLLISAGPTGLAAGEIGDQLGVRQNTMSTNLAILGRAGLIKSQREGRSIRYFADLIGVRDLLNFLMEDCCNGHPEICKGLMSGSYGNDDRATQHS